MYAQLKAKAAVRSEKIALVEDEEISPAMRPRVKF
jgi:hypothetical protein